MKKIKQLCQAIRDHEGHNLSLGSFKTLKMIEDEAEKLQHEIDVLRSVHIYTQNPGNEGYETWQNPNENY